MTEVEVTGSPLTKRIVGAGFWTIFGFAISYPLRLISSLAMTRLLAPEMFGVMSIATVVMTGLAMVSDFGLRPSIIQSSRGDDAEFLNTGWALQIIRGFILWFSALVIAALIFGADHFGLTPKTSAYADPLLPILIAVGSTSTIIDGFRSTKLSQARRWLSLGRLTQISIVAQVAGLICMIAWGLLSPTIWALVAGGLFSSLLTTLLSHLWLPGTNNRWAWDAFAAKEILHFGKWILVSSLLGFVANNADRALLGGLIDPALLGIYTIGFTICSMITNVMLTTFRDVSFSALSELARSRPSELKRGLYKFHTLTGSVVYLCAGGLMGSGDILIRILYDRRYQQAGWMLEILAVGLLTIPFSLPQMALLARGLPKLFTYIIAIRALITIVSIPIGFHYFNLTGALWSIVLSQLSSAFVTVYYQAKFDLLSPLKEFLLLLLVPIGFLLGRTLSFAITNLLFLSLVR